MIIAIMLEISVYHQLLIELLVTYAATLRLFCSKL